MRQGILYIAIRASYRKLRLIYWHIKLRSIDILGMRKQDRKNLSDVSFQKGHWGKVIENESNLNRLENTWGDPTDENSYLGNYLHIKNTLEDIVFQGSTVLDLGSLSGKWIPSMLLASKIICVDINDSFIKIISNRFPKYLEKFSFYVSKGDELKGIDDNSCDIVFSMDSLVRAPKKCIEAYFIEFKRILKPGGVAMILLPNYDLFLSREKNFTFLNTKEIHKIVRNSFEKYTIDSKTLNHGSMVYAFKAKNI